MPQFLVLPGDVHADEGHALLRGAEAHHLLGVHRARPGDSVLLFDGEGNRWSGRLRGASPGACARLGDLAALPSNEPIPRISLVQSLPKGDRWEWILEKGTELGVYRFCPVHSRHSVSVVPDGRRAAKEERWRGVVTAAAKQCERGRIPAIEAPCRLNEFLSRLPSTGQGEARILLAERLTDTGVLPAGPLHSILLAVGPEGGWSAEELADFRNAAFVPLGLGARVLRSETGALAGIVTAQVLWGADTPSLLRRSGPGAGEP